MAYEVEFSPPARLLGKSHVNFVVKQDGETIGTLKITKGSIVWYPPYTSIGRKATWKQFAEKMEQVTDARRRKKP